MNSSLLTVVVPTFNERANVHPLVQSLAVALEEVHWSVLFVDDDSPDGTADEVRALAARDSRVHCLHRVGRRGLASACVDGFLVSKAPYIAVIDGDMQHDERLLRAMLERMEQDSTLDVAVGSRYVDGGSVGAWNPVRSGLSKAATWLTARVFGASLTDPMSGFFMLRRRVVEEVRNDLSGRGFKILLDIFASSERHLRFVELPYVFRVRQFGESKLTSRVVWDFMLLLAEKKRARLRRGMARSLGLRGSESE